MLPTATACRALAGSDVHDVELGGAVVHRRQRDAAHRPVLDRGDPEAADGPDVGRVAAGRTPQRCWISTDSASLMARRAPRAGRRARSRRRPPRPQDATSSGPAADGGGPRHLRRGTLIGTPTRRRPMDTLFIAGAWRPARDARTRTIHCPADGREVVTVAEASEAGRPRRGGCRAGRLRRRPLAPYAGTRAGGAAPAAGRPARGRARRGRPAGVARHRQAVRGVPDRRRRHRRRLPALRRPRHRRRRPRRRHRHARRLQPGRPRAGRASAR